MKKLKAAVLLLLSLTLAGCGFQNADIKDPVTFCYPRKNISYSGRDSVIAGEVREASGHRGDLKYLLTVYLHGPMDQNLRSPFPLGTELKEIIRDKDSLTLSLTSEILALDNTRFTIACASLAQTCFHLTGVDTVIVQSQHPDEEIPESLTFVRDGFLFVDTIPQWESENEK